MISVNRREYNKLRQVHSKIKDFGARVHEASESEEQSVRDVIQDVDEANEILEDVLRRYERQ
jgi:hypothetical protein